MGTLSCAVGVLGIRTQKEYGLRLADCGDVDDSASEMECRSLGQGVRDFLTQKGSRAERHGESCAVLFWRHRRYTQADLSSNCGDSNEHPIRESRVAVGPQAAAELRSAGRHEGGRPTRDEEIHEHSREGARRDAPGGRSVFAGLGFHEFVCRARWTADGGSGVEPGSVLFAELFGGSGVARATQSGAEADAGESAAVCGDAGGAAGDQRD